MFTQVVLLLTMVSFLQLFLSVSLSHMYVKEVPDE